MTWRNKVVAELWTETRDRAAVCVFAGAFIPAVPVQPVVIRYPNKLVSWFIRKCHNYMRHITALILTVCLTLQPIPQR